MVFLRIVFTGEPLKLARGDPKHRIRTSPGYLPALCTVTLSNRTCVSFDFEDTFLTQTTSFHSVTLASGYVQLGTPSRGRLAGDAWLGTPGRGRLVRGRLVGDA